jgi:hypothetical protein
VTAFNVVFGRGLPLVGGGTLVKWQMPGASGADDATAAPC